MPASSETGPSKLQAALLDVLRSDRALDEYRNEPDALAHRHGLSAADMDRIVAADMGWLYARGVHPYILAQFALTIGFDMAEYRRQVTAGAGSAG